MSGRTASPLVPLEESWLRWPLPAAEQVYADIDGQRLKGYVKKPPQFRGVAGIAASSGGGAFRECRPTQRLSNGSLTASGVRACRMCAYRRSICPLSGIRRRGRLPPWRVRGLFALRAPFRGCARHPAHSISRQSMSGPVPKPTLLTET